MYRSRSTKFIDSNPESTFEYIFGNVNKKVLAFFFLPPLDYLSGASSLLKPIYNFQLYKSTNQQICKSTSILVYKLRAQYFNKSTTFANLLIWQFDKF